MKQPNLTRAATRRELLFNLREDPQELSDLAEDTRAAEGLTPWRCRLVEALDDRPEGFVDNGELVPGRPREALVPGYQPNWRRSEFE